MRSSMISFVLFSVLVVACAAACGDAKKVAGPLCSDGACEPTSQSAPCADGDCGQTESLQHPSTLPNTSETRGTRQLGESCESAGDCRSNLCIAFQSQRVCTQFCSGESQCPAGSLSGWPPSGAKKTWGYHVGDTAFTPAVFTSQRMYATFNNGTTGRVFGSTLTWGPLPNWELSLENNRVTTGPVYMTLPGMIAFGTEDGKLQGVDISGNQLWSYATGSQLLADAAVAGERFLVGTIDGLLHAVRTDGGAAWTFNVGGPIVSSPVIDANGRIYVGSANGKLTAINPNGTKVWSLPSGADTQHADDRRGRHDPGPQRWGGVVRPQPDRHAEMALAGVRERGDLRQPQSRPRRHGVGDQHEGHGLRHRQ